MEMKELLLSAARGSSDPLTLYVEYTDFEGENYCYFDVKISPDNLRSESTVNALTGLIGTEYSEMPGLYVYIYDEDLFGDYYYFNFSVADGVSLEQLMEFFENQGFTLDAKL